METSRGSSRRAWPRELFELVPDPWRGWIGQRKARRWVRAVRFARRHNAALRTEAPGVAFFPMRLEPTAGLAFVLARLGVRIAAFGAPAALTIAWETGTWLRPRDGARLPARALNRGCTDISKTTVDRIWGETSGNSISVDPLTTSGPIVVKPDRNAVRAGRVVDGPVSRRQPGVVYQRLVDSRVGDRIHSTRAAIVGGRVVVAYEKWRPYPHWFRGPEVTIPCAPGDVYSVDEQHLLVRFSEQIGMDYGELDVLRDNDSRLVYVVDANRTPVRPKGLAREHEDAWFGPITAAFAELLP